MIFLIQNNTREKKIMIKCKQEMYRTVQNEIQEGTE